MVEIQQGPRSGDPSGGMALVIPCRAVATQGLRGGGLWSRDPVRGLCLAQPKGRDPSSAWNWHGAGVQSSLRGEG
jgi:hypothetical protein